MTVKKIWPLDPGKDSGGFANIDGVSAYVDLDAYHMLSEGMTFEAPAKKMISKASGKPYYKMPDGWLPPVESHVAAQRSAPNGHASTAPPRLATATVGNRADGFRSPVQMFLCEVASAYFGTGKADISEAPEVLRILREAWEMHG
jgi:hypothetical protein